jgi:lipooligosaccharide transport system permease protein
MSAFPELPESRLTPGVRRPLTLVERTRGLLGFHWTLLRRTWRGVVFSRFVTPVFFLVAMGMGVGNLVDRTSGGVGGVPYLDYVVPGIVMASVMQWAVGESTWPVMTLIKWNQMDAAMLAAPTRVPDVLRAHWLMISFGIAWSAGVFVAIAALFGGVSSWWALLGVPIAVLTAMAFVAPLFWFAARTESEEGFTTIFRLVITPLMLFSGTFFPISQLPVWLQPVAWVTPLWHGTELARPSFLGDPLGVGHGGGWVLHLGVLAAYVVVGGWGAQRAFRARLEA